MNVSIYYTKVYKNETAFRWGKNKPNQTQFKPNLVRRRRIAEMGKLMKSVYLQRIMKKNADKSYEKTKPKQTQFKPNQSQFQRQKKCIFRLFSLMSLLELR